jgi:hypothetical protein
LWSFDVTTCGGCQAHRQAIKQALAERSPVKVVQTTVKAAAAFAEDAGRRCIRVKNLPQIINRRR